MFVPDDAKKRRRLDELTPAAWYVYEAHCQARDHKKRRSYASKQLIAEREGLAVKTVANAETELRRKGWIRDDGKGGTILLIGDFSPVDKKHPQPSLFKEGGEPAAPESGSENPYSGKANPCLGTENPQTGIAHYKDRARGSSSPQSSPETSTHTPAPVESAAREAPAARVCVPEPTRRTKHDDFTLKRYASAKGLGVGWLTGQRRTGEWDGDVDDWLEAQKPEAVARAFVEPPPEPRKCPPTCPLCFGSGRETVPGKGARHCPNLLTRAQPPEARAHAPP